METDALLKAAHEAMQKAYSPYSTFKVGASVLTSDRQVFAGCNIENVSYSLTLCAEACAIAHMVAAGDHKIQTVLIVSSGSLICPPCGACRQRLWEFSTDDCMVHLAQENQIKQTYRLDELLPHPFDKQQLVV